MLELLEEFFILLEEQLKPEKRVLLKVFRICSTLASSPYFPINKAKMEYEELSEQYYFDDPSGNRVLQVGLMKRAMESIRRIMRLQQEKPTLQQMVREGVIGESLWEKLLAAESELEQEMKDVMQFYLQLAFRRS
jgi:translocation protein SEC66